MAYRPRKTSRRSTARGSYRRSSGRSRSSGSRRSTGRRASTGRGVTVRVVLQGAAAPSAAPLMLSDAGKLIGPASDKRSKF